MVASSLTLLVVGFVVWTILYPLTVSGQIEQQKEWLTYENIYPLEVKIDYPKDWVYSEETLYQHNFVFFSPSSVILNYTEDEQGVFFSVGIADTKDFPFQNMPLELWIKENKRDNYEKLYKVNYTESIPITLENGTLPAHKNILEYEHERSLDTGTFMRKSMEILTVKNSKAYTLIYTADSEEFSHYLPTVEKMIDSFQIIN